MKDYEMLTRGLLKRMLREQTVIDEGESCTKPRKRKRNASHCTCRRQKPRIPEGYGYVPLATCADENGRYSPKFSHHIRCMSCSRCGVLGDHWPQFCRNPIYDPPEREGALTWKSILGNFNVDEYLEQQKHKSKEPPSEEDTVPRKCTYCRNLARGNTEKPPIPEGYGYVPLATCADENGRYSPKFSHHIRCMSCSRCGVLGDHWPQFCRNPIYDPPEREGALTWKSILGNFNVDDYLEQQKHKSKGLERVTKLFDDVDKYAKKNAAKVEKGSSSHLMQGLRPSLGDGCCSEGGSRRAVQGEAEEIKEEI